jgi:type IV pilus assembly protein PilB
MSELGMHAEMLDRFNRLITNAHGMILVSGPTGSGKSTTLYAALKAIASPQKNIIAIEDPVEYRTSKIRQVQVNPEAKLTFASGLRSMLRQDPDVIMVGEIRDLETAEIAVKAAQTGHMVLSTLHTNDAPQTIARLMNMGIAPFNIISSVTLVIAQRLARKLHDCKKPSPLPKNALLAEGFAEADIDAGLTLYEAVGCDECNDGYKGRTGIYQVMAVTEAIGRIILQGGSAVDIAEEAEREGVWDLRRSGLK